ncbi:uncharacterized protein AMSG_10870 [Thecamonas trahens ATCC 50062]|uniref:Uncharacterized protein n=1 Tax=Thecamonas trahens ATCC 50062 TaxID=461836 RepID=A0A0L0DSQ2_THETB|nr:hypothetical protein AMSG_10870 [Thecamonas trahens ATCC 50062]KNC55237.1 hypothetical protein AMSG_10870 [Thecamonas trahens ATCC 50062]|eukprot:XP_013753166.1 hypothetical protein AMSG_10870 [Thecamonas trahens ATCC 50062]
MESKYKRLVAEYARVKGHNAVLKKAVVEEQENSARLSGALNLLRQKNRRLASWWSGSSAKQVRIDELEAHVHVLEEQLAHAIAQAEVFGSEKFEAQRAHAEEVATLNGHVKALEASLVAKSDELTAAAVAADDAAADAQAKIETLESALAAVTASYEATLAKLASLQGEVSTSLRKLNDSHFGGVAPFYYPLLSESESDTSGLAPPASPIPHARDGSEAPDSPLDLRLLLARSAAAVAAGASHSLSLPELEDAVDSLVSGLESSFMAFQASAIALATPDRTAVRERAGSAAPQAAEPRQALTFADDSLLASAAKPVRASAPLSPLECQRAVQHACERGAALARALGRAMQLRAAGRGASPKLATLAGQCFTTLSAIAAQLGEASSWSADDAVEPQTGALTGTAVSAGRALSGAFKKLLPYMLAYLRVDHQVVSDVAPELKGVNNALGPLFATVAAAVDALVAVDSVSKLGYASHIEPLVGAVAQLEVCLRRNYEIRDAVIAPAPDLSAACADVLTIGNELRMALSRLAFTPPSPGSEAPPSSTLLTPATPATPAPPSTPSNRPPRLAVASPLVASPLASPMVHSTVQRYIDSDAADVIAKLQRALAAKTAQLEAIVRERGTVVVLDTAAPGPRDETKLRMRLHYEDKVSSLERLLTAADARAGEMYQAALAAKHELKDMQGTLDETLHSVSDRDIALAAARDELETTRRNYEEQLNTLTNHICSLQAARRP